MLYPKKRGYLNTSDLAFKKCPRCSVLYCDLSVKSFSVPYWELFFEDRKVGEVPREYRIKAIVENFGYIPSVRVFRTDALKYDCHECKTAHGVVVFSSKWHVACIFIPENIADKYNALGE